MTYEARMMVDRLRFAEWHNLDANEVSLEYMAANLIGRQAAELDIKQAEIDRLTAELSEIKREREAFLDLCVTGLGSPCDYTTLDDAMGNWCDDVCFSSGTRECWRRIMSEVKRL